MSEIGIRTVLSGTWRKAGNNAAYTSDTCGPWSPASVGKMITRLRAVLQRLVEDGTLRRNPASLVKPPARAARGKRRR
ncbi:hypothetical protein [Gordonia polyisoprenivorans]|uniref:hypothetical protein n=1 Tax=Gordonia polyisoprenivorans TaxID=84595 RepID=UPI001AD7E2CA|nr:hypothetical protein [Gordonia polyisoprenivorans]QTI67389.1 hypothetical protein J6U32_17465 [Gordonia polyisoprenivorans]